MGKERHGWIEMDVLLIRGIVVQGDGQNNAANRKGDQVEIAEYPTGWKSVPGEAVVVRLVFINVIHPGCDDPLRR